jgi:ferritin-like metal-binding protein YciE
MASTTQKAKKKNVNVGADLEDLLVAKLKTLYDIESELLKVLPAMAKKANDPDLKELFEEHLEETEGHAERLLQIFELLEVKAQKLSSASIRGLVADAEWVMKNVKSAASQDAALISAASAVEYCEIANYETAIIWAKFLEKDEVALEETLEEEDNANEKLGDLAEMKINEKAMPAGFVKSEDRDVEEDGKHQEEDGGRDEEEEDDDEDDE